MNHTDLQRLFERTLRVARRSATGRAVVLRKGRNRFHVLPSCAARINDLEDQGFEALAEFGAEMTVPDFQAAIGGPNG
jgi:hypothetical protein